jgi:hypothetical protein
MSTFRKDRIIEIISYKRFINHFEYLKLITWSLNDLVQYARRIYNYSTQIDKHLSKVLQEIN